MFNITVRRSVRRPRRGFTLTELAIVLGIIGLILGAIWTAASSVYANMKANQAQKDLLVIVQNLRTLYGSSPNISCSGSCDITAAVAAADVFPKDMITQPVVDNDTTTYPQSPWGTQMEVLVGNQGAPNTAFYIQMSVDQVGINSGCPLLIDRMLGVPGIIGMITTGLAGKSLVGGSYPNYNLATAVPSDPAIAGCNNVGFLFQLH